MVMVMMVVAILVTIILVKGSADQAQSMCPIHPCLAALLQWRSMFRMVLIMRPRCWLDSSVTLCDEDDYMLYSSLDEFSSVKRC